MFTFNCNIFNYFQECKGEEEEQRGHSGSLACKSVKESTTSPSVSARVGRARPSPSFSVA